MAMVACGAADAYFEFGIHIWDIAAGELIITEAGGAVIDPAGGQVSLFLFPSVFFKQSPSGGQAFTASAWG